MSRAYVALGSNLGDSCGQLRMALDALAQLPDTRVLACSHFYRTPPWGVTDQPPFTNAAAMLETALAPRALLDAMLAIERDQGRRRDGARWGPRTLDLDLLHVEDVVQHDLDLTLPHPRLAERAFVLLPLYELAPTLVVPGQGVVADLLATVDTTGCEVLPDGPPQPGAASDQ